MRKFSSPNYSCTIAYLGARVDKKMKDFPLITLIDGRSKCISVLATLDFDTYFSLVNAAYQDQGGLAGC